MKETLRTKLFDESLIELNKKYPELPESKARNISSAMATRSIELLIENNKNLDENTKIILLEAERNKRMFRGHVESLQRESKIILQKLRENGCISYNYDQKLRRNVITARSSVLRETVEFLNKLNTFVIEFYKDVYKIDEQNNDDRTQITLF